MLLSSYLLALSKVNSTKALEIWFQFNSIEWIPEFSFEFYLNFLQDSLGDYETSTRLYNYMVGLPRNQTPITPESYFITPPNPEALSRFFQLAIIEEDKTTVLKMLRESFVRGTNFSFEAYLSLFQFLKNEELIVKIVNNHGSSNSKPFEFLTHLTQHIPNLPIYEISKTLYFKKLINSYSMQKSEDYQGFYVVFSSVFDQFKTKNENGVALQEDSEEIRELIELCSPLVLEFHDVNNYYTEFDTHNTIAFKNELTAFFKKLTKGVKDEEGLSGVAVNAIGSLQC
jgi:hypothetical protein